MCSGWMDVGCMVDGVTYLMCRIRTEGISYSLIGWMYVGVMNILQQHIQTYLTYIYTYLTYIYTYLTYLTVYLMCVHYQTSLECDGVIQMV